MNARMAAALAVAIVSIGYAVAVRPLESRIAERYAVIASARATIAGGSWLGERIAAARREQGRLRATLARTVPSGGNAATLQRFLDATGRAATRHAIAIRALEADPVPSASVPAAGALFDELSLRLTLRGSYGALLATLRELVTAPPAKRLALEMLAPDERRDAGGALVAVVHVVLLRLPDGGHAGPDPH